MVLFFEFIKLIAFLFGIVLVSKYLLVPTLQKISEQLNLSAKASGNVAGIATSIPELLTVAFSVKSGLIDTSVYNIISSNIINLLQYFFSIYLNKNQKYIMSKPILIDLAMVFTTIAIPTFLVAVDIELNLMLCFIFVILLILFFYINHNVHKLYLEEEDREILKESSANFKIATNKKKIKLILYIMALIGIALILYFLGDLLSESLTNLAIKFGLPEIFLGALLGVVTSFPELITFTESQRKERAKKSELARKVGVVEATNNLLTSNTMNLFVVQTLGILLYL